MPRRPKLTRRSFTLLSPQEQKKYVASIRRNRSMWIKEGFLPDEADALARRRIFLSRGTKTQHDIVQILRENRRYLVERLRDELGLNEREIYNYLRHELELQRIGHVIDLFETDELTGTFFRASPQTQMMYTNTRMIPHYDLTEINTEAQKIDYAADEEINFRGHWMRLRGRRTKKATQRRKKS